MKKRVFDPGVHCGGKTRSGTPCLRFKGQGTDHPRAGRCSKHGGSTTTGRKAALREAGLTFARGQLGAEVALDAMDALDQSVRLASGLVDYYRFELADQAVEAASDDEEKAARARKRTAEILPLFTEAIKLQKDVSKAATDAGVAERRQVLAERLGALIGAALEDALAVELPELVDPATRLRVVRAFGSRLALLEASDEPVILGQARALPPAA